MDKISILTPTTKDRKDFIKRLDLILSRQTVQPYEWIINDFDGNIGTKRNKCIAEATGDILINMDDDDIRTPTYIENAVKALKSASVPLVGLHKFPMHDVANNVVRMFENHGYIAEGTMTFWRSAGVQFPNVSMGEGAAVLRAMPFKSYLSDDFLATIHGANTCGHKTMPLLKKLPHDEAAFILERFYN